MLALEVLPVGFDVRDLGAADRACVDERSLRRGPGFFSAAALLCLLLLTLALLLGLDLLLAARHTVHR